VPLAAIGDSVHAQVLSVLLHKSHSAALKEWTAKAVPASAVASRVILTS
jgi:hypothetical protein